MSSTRATSAPTYEDPCRGRRSEGRGLHRTGAARRGVCGGRRARWRRSHHPGARVRLRPGGPGRDAAEEERASGRGGAAARGTQDPHPDAHRARHHGGRGARARRRRRRLSRQAIQVRRVVGAGARTDPAGRREPHGTPELWTGRARPPEAQGQGQGQEARAHAQGIPAARAFPLAAGGGDPAHRAAREGVGSPLRPREQRGGRPCGQSSPQTPGGRGARVAPHRAGRRVPARVPGSGRGVTRSLRRALAVRFAATMGVGLVVAAAAAYATALGPAAGMHRELMVLLAGVVVVGTGATLVGAWWLAGSAVRPVYEITEQATRIAPGTLDQRIAAHVETDEYRGLVAVLNGMLERLDQAFHNQRRLTADVSHELRSPLTALRGEVEVALRSERSPRDYRRVLHSALEEIDRLTEMSEDLLLITRADAHLLQAHRVPTDINAIVGGVVDALQPRIEERELAVDCRFAPDATHAVVDADLVTRLVRQLLENAVKFTPPGGRVRVATTALNGEGGIQIVVEDTGPGLAPELLPHVFEPFFRADEARTRGTGTGLGLAMVAAITRLHGGRVHAANVTTAGTGARFEVDLVAVAHS